MKFFKKLGAWLTKTFNTGFGLIKNHSFIAVAITQNLKKAVEGDWDNRIVSLLPGNLPPIALAAAEKYLPLVARHVLTVHNILQVEKQNDSVGQLIEYLRGLDKEDRGDKLAAIAARMNIYLADGSISLSEAWKEAQIIYQDFFKGK